MWQRVFLALIGCLSFSLQAELRHFVADIEVSQWHLSQDNPLSCQLEHDIPAYGKAVFTSHASKENNLNFSLDMWIKPNKVTQVQLISIAPTWRPGKVSEPITALSYQQSFNGEVSDGIAWSMLTQLKSGMQPTFYYNDWYNAQNQVAVGLSSVNFNAGFRAFKACVAKLLPYSFEDIAFTVLSYRVGSKELTSYAQSQLNKIKAYFVFDPSVELVLIDAYSDSYGSRSSNQTLSQRRADAVKALLMESGIEEGRILTVAHGEKRYVASNRSMDERAKNRRVVIRITKS
ncbi:flagellar protein MotY [Shewanella surugensis]|uniref:OmpA family protein n=1 Tax=Shewanella surugensis TaxID=212020 RepID=A0ABT0LFB6_9GAMM|nr:OmpA family protein [Shewanella surugensis]MCL1126389.1 OmpA family protein [Shewanella surugensis]